MTSYDFDTPVDRRGTSSIKWSGGDQDGRWLASHATDGPVQDVESLPMWLADMDFKTAPAIVAALQRRVSHGVFGYTHTDDAFYSSVIEWTRQHHGWAPEPDWLFTNSGVMPAINLAVQTFTRPGDRVLVQSPVFHPIPEAADFNDRVVVPSPLVIEDGRYRMDLPDLRAKAEHPDTRMMILCSPHNPVGVVWSDEELGQVASVCSDNDVLLVSDEIHADLTYSWSHFTSIGSLLGDGFDQFIVCGGPSKAFNLPGLKLSLTFVPNPELRMRYEAAMRNLNELWGTNLLGATAVTAAYTEGGEWLEALRSYLEGNIQIVEAFLRSRVPNVRLVRPDALYMLWLDARSLDLTSHEMDARLRAAGLWLEQGATYGTEGEGFLRMTIATPRVILESGLQRLAAALG